MKKKTRKYVAIGIFSLIMLAIFVCIYNFNGLFSITETEFGWIPIGELDDGFTNREITENLEYPSHTMSDGNEYICDQIHISGGGCQSGGVRVNSEYFDIDIKVWDNFINGRFEGGERDITFYPSSRGEYGEFGSATLTLNKPLKEMHLKFNYELKITPSRFASGQSSFSVLTVSEGISSGYDKGSVEIIPSVLDTNVVEVILNGISLGTTTIEDNELLKIDISTSGGNARFYNFRYRPLFGCEIDNDEVLIFDDFDGGSTIDINSLSHPVRKFCYNHNPVIRSYTDLGLAQDQRSEIFDALSRGNSLTIPDDQVWRIPYITMYEEGIIQRCSIGEAFNTQTNNCEIIVSEGVIEDKDGVTIQVISVGTNEYLYQHKFDSQPLKIGRFSVTGTTPVFTCCSEVNSGYINVDKPRKECWQTKINGDIIISGEKRRIAPYIDVEYTLGGWGVYKGERKGISYKCTFVDNIDWINYFKVILDMDGITINSNEMKYDYKLKESAKLKVSIDNKIANFKDAGMIIKYTGGVLDRVDEAEYKIELIKGVKDYEIPIKTDIIGRRTMEVLTYVKVEEKRIFDDSKVIYNYNVLTEPANGDLPPDGEKPKYTMLWYERLWNWIINLLR